MNQQNPGQDQNGSGQPAGNNGGGHPAWQEYLKDVPDALKPLVESAFKQWDANVTQRFQEIHQQYAPLKQYEVLAQSQIPIQRIGEALQFANELEKDPKAMALRINQAFSLGLTEQNAQQPYQQTDPNGFSDPYGENNPPVDIMQHPVVQQMQQALQQVQKRINEQDEQSQVDAEAAQFEQYVNQLFEGKPHLKGNTDAMLVFTSFVDNGLDANTALQKVDQIYSGNIQQQLEQNVNQQQTVEQPGNTDNMTQAILDSLGGGNQQVTDEAPVVMGGAGTVGSGSPTNQINWADMPNQDINALVADVLKTSQQNG